MRSPTPLVARSRGVDLAGGLWLPPGPPVALLVMHPGSGPSDRDNDVYFPPIRAALLARHVAVASFDKRGVGGSGGSWLEAGIEEQADDLLSGVAAAHAEVPEVPVGVFGHSQGGWVVLEAVRRAAPSELAFAVTSSGPAVTVGAQERYSTHRTLVARRVPAPDAARIDATTDELYSLAERRAGYDEMLAWAADPARADDIALALAHGAFGDELPPRPLWDLLVLLAAFDPLPALRAVRVPLLAVFGDADDVVPVDVSVSVLRDHVDPARLQVAVLAGGGHRLSPPGATGFVDGYPDVVVDFVAGQGGR
jgi:pimeloyl-ACP methyl ester carboxylesterase